MFQSGTYVVYGCKGVHKILGTTRLDLEGIPKDKDYYVMQAVKKPDGAVYAPVEASRTNMRSVMTREQAESFLHTAEHIHALTCKTPKQNGIGAKRRKSKTGEEAHSFGFTFHGAG